MCWNYVFGKIRCAIKTWNQTLRENILCMTIRTLPINVALSFFKFRKYYAAHNSGLKIWLVSGIFEMAQLFNLKFCVYLCWLGVGFSPQFSSRETLNAIYFPNLRWTLRSYFFARKLMKNVAEKFCVISEIWTELCRKTLCWKYIAENQTLRDRSSLRDNGNPKTKLCG